MFQIIREIAVPRIAPNMGSRLKVVTAITTSMEKMKAVGTKKNRGAHDAPPGTHLKILFRREMPDFRAKDAKPDAGIAWPISRRDERLAAENMVIAAERGF